MGPVISCCGGGQHWSGASSPLSRGGYGKDLVPCKLAGGTKQPGSIHTFTCNATIPLETPHHLQSPSLCFGRRTVKNYMGVSAAPGPRHHPFICCLPIVIGSLSVPFGFSMGQVLFATRLPFSSETNNYRSKHLYL